MRGAGRVTAAALALALCAGCLPEAQRLRPDPPAESRLLVVAMQEGMSSYAVGAADLFARKLAEISGGALTAEVVTGPDPLALFDAGGDIMFAPNETVARANGDFASYTSPFYFHDYKHMSLTLNNESFNALIGDATRSLLGGESIGAFYDGGSALVSMTERMLDTVDQFADIELAVREDEILEYTFKEMGSDVTARSIEQRISGFDRGRDPSIECDLLDLERLIISPSRENLNICLSFHTVKINWMMLSSETEAALSDWERAVLAEAVAWAVAQNDEAVLAAEERGQLAIEEKGGSFTGISHSEFSEAVDKILMQSARYGNLWNWDLHREVRDLAQY